ncbi:MAG: hypothetical protein JWQ20_2651 [Conexibacter sp.]|nr:hypothetical protein [Conexibacter sp.]
MPVQRDRSWAIRSAAEGRLGLEVDRGAGCVVVRLSGELDLAAADRLRTVLDGARPPVGRLVLDLRDLTFMDCAGIGVLVDERERAEAGAHSVTVSGASGEVAELLALTGLDERLRAGGDQASPGARRVSGAGGAG